ncbi:MAG: TniQ family protein [Pseudophaeobacter sp. bin_em_oilr2.035]|uniref:TniQ family protein n=1 Tax=Phaeobacter gallaeciensis TaxID=60890 RepID=A0ABD4X7U2_9RHOB|nr:TniQ family protein [Phaeobacter gallaeciensis]MDF1773928.1 TniQ family protein [Pseudophaeobacter sp. bin_em_oilr2.035]MDE4144830.1 TniQ family protein [Phaeobacter gallaeciensis]MDE4157131.1 TniQ family protein [Phaeobacter gallaeciensis]MDE4161317.1 TniQ family protein [Phaeobacter gallaeciensis]MDE4165538.1 TniQ family protein [Phaeobacter gallaeciensis]
MVDKLRLAVEPCDRETLPSYFSRMAAINGTDTAGFALDLGFSFKRILEQDELAVAAFAARSGLTQDQLSTLLSWTGERIGDVRMRYRGEVFISRALRSPTVRGCPHCLREQAEGQTYPLRHMTISGAWQCRGADLCIRHHHPLVPLWTYSRPLERYNIGARLAEILPDIAARRFDSELIEPSAYDRWLDHRLFQGNDDTWLATQPLFAAMTFCGLLGAALLNKQGEESEDRKAKSLGFVVASQGPDAIREELGRLTLAEDGGDAVTRGELAPIFKTFDRLYRHDDAFDGFRDIVRAHVLEIWPIAAGEEILGQIMVERRLHSLTSASKETGIGTAVLNDFLTEAGAFSSDDARSDARKTFNAREFQALLDEIPTLVGRIAMRRAIGATLAELKSLEADDVLVPRTKVRTIKSPWRVRDGLALLEELELQAIPIDEDTPGWDTIQLVHKRLGVSVGRVINEIRDGNLGVGKRRDVFGDHGFVVQIAEVERLTKHGPQGAKSTTIGNEISAAAFARSIGVREKGAFLALIEGGHTPATEISHPVMKRPQWRMTSSDITAFHETFTTPTVMAEESGMHRNTILAALAAGDVHAFQPDGVNVGPIYLRDEVEAILRNLVI